ncbi:MAG: hypothetical protein D6744_16535 [Planctomycetota bacterium]|nr:MAG: hypothetical protein D6744_16535 [Planctomycetota bacterium]
MTKQARRCVRLSCVRTPPGEVAMMTDTLVDKWVVVELCGQRYALPVAAVRELLSARGVKLVQLPQAAEDVVGVLKLRDETVPILDLRNRLGMQSLESEIREFLQLLADRRKDHEDWLTELEACVRESRKFRLATDPHKCKFGKWYDALRANARELQRWTNGDLSMRRIIDDFDGPHQRIHAITQKVEEFLEQGDVDAAQAIIERTRQGDLASMNALFEEAARLLPELRQPSIVIVEYADRRWGLMVDALIDVESISMDDVSDPEMLAGGPTEGFARQHGSDALVSLLSIERVLGEGG